MTRPKTGNPQNYKLQHHMSKVLLIILLERFKMQVKGSLAEEQASFYEDNETAQQVMSCGHEQSCSWTNIKKSSGRLFCHLQKDIWLNMAWCGVSCSEVVWHDQEIACHAKNHLWRNEVNSLIWRWNDWLKMMIGNRQGAPISPPTFQIYLERIKNSWLPKASGQR